MSTRVAWPALPALILLLVFFLFPVVRMLGFSLEGGTLEWYAKALGEGLYLRVMWNTFEIALLVMRRVIVARQRIDVSRQRRLLVATGAVEPVASDACCQGGGQQFSRVGRAGDGLKAKREGEVLQRCRSVQPELSAVGECPRSIGHFETINVIERG